MNMPLPLCLKEGWVQPSVVQSHSVSPVTTPFHSAPEPTYSSTMDLFMSVHIWTLLSNEESPFVLFFLLVVVQKEIYFISSEGYYFYDKFS